MLIKDMTDAQLRDEYRYLRGATYRAGELARSINPRCAAGRILARNWGSLNRRFEICCAVARNRGVDLLATESTTDDTEPSADQFAIGVIDGVLTVLTRYGALITQADYIDGQEYSDDTQYGTVETARTEFADAALMLELTEFADAGTLTDRWAVYTTDTAEDHGVVDLPGFLAALRSVGITPRPVA